MHFSSRKIEWVLLAVAWMLIYASSPLYMYYAMLAIEQPFEWKEVGMMWGYDTAFLLVFLFHHFVLLPKLVVKKRIGLYVVSILATLLLFVGYLKWVSPIPPANVPNIALEHPFLLPPPDMARLVIALLMLGVDLGVAAWFNGQNMRQRLLLLEKQNLKQELEHLRYQINPHFFMNTLNNIHVLIDVDKERAQRAIVELSGMMRYALYEGNGSLVTLDKEMAFLQQYISLMRLRYSDKVRITYSVPETLPAEARILPLLLPTFVENAFKHGVSYCEDSFIDVQLAVDSQSKKICFRCHNSRHAVGQESPDKQHGIGLDNVRKRLELQYGDNYSLNIDADDAAQYCIELILPY
ncbi:MAG: histidine kinase [Bacteroidales bacterium]|nr:histidine kinase [Bacteroidales bacterium]